MIASINSVTKIHHLRVYKGTVQIINIFFCSILRLLSYFFSSLNPVFFMLKLYIQFNNIQSNQENQSCDLAIRPEFFIS